MKFKFHMKNLTLSFLLLLSTQLFAAKKTYTLDIVLTSLYESKAISGIIVECTDEDGQINVDTTDVVGKVDFKIVRKQSYLIKISDPNNLYVGKSFGYYHYEKVNASRSFILPFTQEKEHELFASKVHKLVVVDSLKYFIEANKEVDECSEADQEDFEFPGGLGEMAKFIQTHLNYPQSAVEEEIQDKVMVVFIVEIDGSVSNIVIAKSGGFFDIEREAIRIVCYFPKLIPAKCNGTTVRSIAVLPINFSLE